MKTIIAQNEKETKSLEVILKNYFLYFYMPHYNGTEWLDYDLPIPTMLKHSQRGIFIGWALDGFFGTKKGQDFLNDIIARYLITFPMSERLPYKPQKEAISEETHLSNGKYKLKEFQGLKAIVRAKKLSTRRADNFHDHVFWAIKFYCEELIQSQGIATYDQMIGFAFVNFEYKEGSTLRAKVRSVFNWYEERDFKLSRKNKNWEDDMERRKENAKKVSEEKAKLHKAKVLGAITQLQHLEKKLTAVNIQKLTNQNPRTVRKYLKEYKQAQPQQA
jgi:hypothetical protein